MGKMKLRSLRPSGNRELGEVLQRTEKAIRFGYHGWSLWIPKSAITKVRRGPYTAPAWAIESAKEHPSASHIRDAVYFEPIRESV